MRSLWWFFVLIGCLLMAALGESMGNTWLYVASALTFMCFVGVIGYALLRNSNAN